MNALSHKDLPRLPKRGRPTLNEGKKRDVPLKSLDNALLVLNELANHGPLSLSDLARRTEFSVPTTHRILSTFAARGYVVLDEETQMWSLGAQSHFVGARYLQPEGLTRLAKSNLKALASDSRETAILGVLDRSGLCIVDQCIGPQTLSVQFPIGTVLPAATSAHGKALLSKATKATKRRYQWVAPTTPEGHPDAIYGVAVDDGEMDETLFGVAVVVTDTFDKAIAAIGIYSPRLRLGKSSPDDLGGLIHRSAATLSMTLSGQKLRCVTKS